MEKEQNYKPLLLRREEGEGLLDLSHLLQFVSAYHYSEQIMQDLREDLVKAVERARKEKRQQIVHQDGPMFFLVSQSGGIELCVPWKRYVLADPAQAGTCPYCSNWELKRDPNNKTKDVRVYCGRNPGHTGDCDFVRV